MNQMTFTAELARTPRFAADVEGTHDHDVWRDVATMLRERTYTTGSGTVRVRADWSAVHPEATIVEVELDVVDEGASISAHDSASFVERFFHDLFLIVNIAAPGAFGGIVSTAGDVRVSELAFDASPFEFGWVAALRGGGGTVTALPLENVISWHDELQLGTREIAEGAIEEVLFHLLQIARSGDEWATRVRLTRCLDALAIGDDAMRRALDVTRAPVLHPLHDVDEAEAIRAVDQAMSLVLATLQASVNAAR
ncbi:MAG TPA: hypothetical protein VF911_06645 [Thermoanaerobaculia bacterium]